eukprot:50114-Hanusia_phi.AAC.3
MAIALWLTFSAMAGGGCGGFLSNPVPLPLALAPRTPAAPPPVTSPPLAPSALPPPHAPRAHPKVSRCSCEMSGAQNFRTEINVKEFPVKIKPEDSIVLMGSCFSGTSSPQRTSV